MGTKSMAKIILFFAFISTIFVSSRSSWSKSHNEQCKEYGKEIAENLCKVPETKSQIIKDILDFTEGICGGVDFQDKGDRRIFINNFRVKLKDLRRQRPPAFKDIPMYNIRINSEDKCGSFVTKLIIKMTQNMLEFVQNCGDKSSIDVDLQCYDRWNSSVKKYFKQNVCPQKKKKKKKKK